jgi:hypothetical protein
MKIEKRENVSTDLLIVIIITIVGLAGNALNLRVFSHRKLRNVTTFRYLFYISIIDIILLIIWPLNKLIATRFIIIPDVYLKRVFKLIAFSLSYLYQMNSWLTMSANINRARLLKNEVKYSENKNKSFHLKALILIGLFLLVLDSHYLIFYNFDLLSHDFKPMNTTNQFHNFMIKSKNNITLFKTNRVLNLTNIFKLNRFDRQNGILEYGNIFNKKYDIFLTKIWDRLQIIMFDLTPIIINLLCTILVTRYTSRLRNENRKEFNKQFILYFIISNIYLIICVFNINHFKLKVYKLEQFHVQMLMPQIFSYSKHAFSFLIYFLTFGIYRNVILTSPCFIKRRRTLHENIQLDQIISQFSRIETRGFRGESNFPLGSHSNP